MEAYVNAVRSVSPKLRGAKQTGWGRWLEWPRPVWIAATVTVAVALFLAKGWLAAPAFRTETAILLLHTSRGIEGLENAKASAGQPLILDIDLTEIPQSSSYRLE